MTAVLVFENNKTAAAGGHVGVPNQSSGSCTGNCAVKLCEIPKNSCYVHIDFQEIQIEGLEVSVTLLGCYHISSRSKHSLPLFRLL